MKQENDLGTTAINGNTTTEIAHRLVTHQLEVGVRKIVAFTQKRLFGEFGTSITKTVAEVELGGVTALTDVWQPT